MDTENEPDGQKPPGGSSTDDAPKDPPKKDPAVGLQNALEKERGKRQAAEAKLAKRDAADADAEQKRKEKLGEWEALATERQTKLDAANARIETFEKAGAKRTADLKVRNKAKIDALPENVRSLVPTAYEPEALGGWLDQNSAALGGVGKTATGLPRSKGGTPGEVKVHPDVAAEAKRHGKDPAWWLENVEKKRRKPRLAT